MECQRLSRKDEELVRQVHIDFAAITEIKKKLKATKEIGNYTMISGGVPHEKQAAVGVVIFISK